jgi:hypothetical protein
MFKYIVIIIIILSSLLFFNLVFIPLIVIKLMEFIVPVSMLFLLLIYEIYDTSSRFKHRFNFEIRLIFCAVVLSMFGAYYFHKQDFGITVMTQRFIYFLVLYSLLHVLKPKPEELIRIILYIGFIFAVLYLLQTLIYPAKLYNGIMILDRGTLRIFMRGSGFLFLTYLIGLSQFIKTYNVKYLFLCVLAIVIFVLLGTRQVIAPAAFVTILSVLLSKKVKSKAVTIILLIGISLPVYFMFQDIFMAMFNVSHKEATHFSSNDRYRAAIFFLFDFFPNKLSYIIGNGVPSDLSPYGIQVKSFNEVLGYYQSDIGIIGDYATFGILLVIAQISIYTRVLLMKLPGELDFIKYNFIVLFLTIFISDGAFSYSENIVIICILLYLIDSSFSFKPENTGFTSIHRKDETLIPNQ